jgi:S-ribosylhomocysteine lyase
MNKIPSFEKDHTTMTAGFHVSMQDKGITTFDLRFIKPNCGRYMSPAVMHSIEHILATLLRNSAYKENIVYFGPMGCRTGFYLLTRDLPIQTAKELVTDCINKAADLKEVPGATIQECGNYKEHNLTAAKKHLKKYLELLTSITSII